MRAHDVLEHPPLKVHGLLTQAKRAPSAAAQWDGPPLTLRRFRVFGDDRQAGEVPTTWEVVVDERLQGYLLHVVSVKGTGHGGDISEWCADNPVTANGQCYRR
jgi:hypothetical protein